MDTCQHFITRLLWDFDGVFWLFLAISYTPVDCLRNMGYTYLWLFLGDRGPAFEFLISQLEKYAANPFTPEHNVVGTNFVTAHVLVSQILWLSFNLLYKLRWEYL